MSAAEYKAHAESNLMVDVYRDEAAANVVAVAQVNATLYLAEQQRIANAIAAASDPTGFLAQNLDDIRMGLAGEVWEGLGLA